MRKAPLITKEEFAKHLKAFKDKYDAPYDNKKVEKDLSKILFDWENYGNEFDEEEITVLSNGLPVNFMYAGGDWEFPVRFILYWDGKEIRAYIPTDGNVFNKKHKVAYGSEGEKGIEDTPEEDVPEVNVDEMEKDIINRIQIV